MISRSADLETGLRHTIGAVLLGAEVGVPGGDAASAGGLEAAPLAGVDGAEAGPVQLACNFICSKILRRQ